MVIDDSPIAREAMVRALKSAGLNATSLASPIGATRAILRHEVQLVVIDVNMPAMRGDRLALLFRGNPKFNELKLVLVSGEEPDALDRLAKEASADAVVPKTSDYASLITTIRQLLRSR